MAPQSEPANQMREEVPFSQTHASARPWEAELPALMVRYQHGDPEAVDELVRKLSGMLMQFLGAFGLSRADAEDLFQECWIRIHNSRHTYRPPEPALPWIFAIARHTRLDGYRRRRRRENREVLVANPPDLAAPVNDAPQPDLTEFRRMLESLPESQQEVIFMLKVTGMSLEEVARATSSTVGAIKQKAHRAYEKLRLVLEGERK
ncbi:MAG: RNA polymerase sigma factor [Bryobacteraceae bacterium]|nr:RNA polymerase sigma factor [Bryobacteraceae bacterium]